MFVIFDLSWHIICIITCNDDVPIKMIYGIFNFNTKATQQTANIFKINYMCS